MFLDDLLSFIKCILLAILAIIALIFTIIVIGLSVEELCVFLDYHLDNSQCTLKIDGKEVYKGRTFYVNTSSIGENGNTKRVVIFKDKWHLHPDKYFISDKVEMY